MKTILGLADGLQLGEILFPIKKGLAQVEENLLQVGHESDGILAESSEYVLSGGGKRLRAALCLFCYGIKKEGAEISASVIEMAAALELIHAATLVHDDIIDHAVMRRKKASVNQKYGDDLAVLLGDFLYARAFHKVAAIGNSQLTELLAHTTQVMCEGEIDQLKNRYLVQLTLENYLKFITQKTAALIGVSAMSGAILGDLDSSQQEKLCNFGINMGIAFQMVDDLLDIVGEEKTVGKPVRADLSNGKMTLPLILLVQSASAEDLALFEKEFASPEINWEQLSELAKKYNVFTQSEEIARRYYQQAIGSLEGFPEATVKTLTHLTQFVLKREY